MVNHEVLKTAEELLDNLEVDRALPLVQSLVDAGVTEAYGMLAYIYMITSTKILAARANKPSRQPMENITQPWNRTSIAAICAPA